MNLIKRVILMLLSLTHTKVIHVEFQGYVRRNNIKFTHEMMKVFSFFVNSRHTHTQHFHRKAKKFEYQNQFEVTKSYTYTFPRERQKKRKVNTEMRNAHAEVIEMRYISSAMLSLASYICFHHTLTCNVMCYEEM